MTFADYQTALSPARLNRYVTALAGDTQKALTLYRLNVLLSRQFYGLISVYEVCLRNRIDTYYATYFTDSEWLKNQCTGTGFLNDPAFKAGGFKSRKNVDGAICSLGIKYTHDRLVASMTLGFWVNLFAPLQFRLAHQLDTSYATSHYDRLITLTKWLGFDSADLYQSLDEVLVIIGQINAL